MLKLTLNGAYPQGGLRARTKFLDSKKVWYITTRLLLESQQSWVRKSQVNGFMSQAKPALPSKDKNTRKQIKMNLYQITYVLNDVVIGQIKWAQAFSIVNGIYTHLGKNYGTLLTQIYLNQVHQISLYLCSLRNAIYNPYMNGSSKILSRKLLFRIQGIPWCSVCTS